MATGGWLRNPRVDESPRIYSGSQGFLSSLPWMVAIEIRESCTETKPWLKPERLLAILVFTIMSMCLRCCTIFCPSTVLRSPDLEIAPKRNCSSLYIIDLASLAQSRPFDLLVFQFWSIFSKGPKRLTFYFLVFWASEFFEPFEQRLRFTAGSHSQPSSPQRGAHVLNHENPDSLVVPLSPHFGYPQQPQWVSQKPRGSPQKRVGPHNTTWVPRMCQPPWCFWAFAARVRESSGVGARLRADLRRPSGGQPQEALGPVQLPMARGANSRERCRRGTPPTGESCINGVFVASARKWGSK